MNLRINSLALMAAAVALLWACSVPASATVLTTSGGSVYTSTIKAQSEGSVVLKGPLEIKCGKSTIEGTVESHGAEVPTKVKLSALTFSECGSSTVTVLKAGTLELRATSEGNATLASSGAEITTLNSGLDCIYTTTETKIGTFTGSIATLPNNPAMDVSGTLARTGGSALCGATGTLTGSYKVTTPSILIAIPKFKGAGLGISPNPVTFAKNPAPLTLENTGTENIGPLKMAADAGFKPSLACMGETLTTAGANKTCVKETLKCETPGQTGLYWAYTLVDPLVLNAAFLEKC